MVAAVGGFSLRVVLVEAVVLVVLPLTAVEPGRHVAHPVRQARDVGWRRVRVAPPLVCAV